MNDIHLVTERLTVDLFLYTFLQTHFRKNYCIVLYIYDPFTLKDTQTYTTNTPINRTPPHTAYLDGHQYLLLLRRQVVTLCEEDFAEGPFSQLPLQHDVMSFNMLDN